MRYPTLTRLAPFLLAALLGCGSTGTSDPAGLGSGTADGTWGPGGPQGAQDKSGTQGGDGAPAPKGGKDGGSEGGPQGAQGAPQGAQGAPGGGDPYGEAWPAGEVKPVTLQPQPIVFERFTCPPAAVDEEAGRRIGSMYQRMADKPWQKTGPALVTIDSRTDDSVTGRVAFPLAAPADDAASIQLEAGELPGGPALATVHYGLRTDFAAGDATLDAFLQKERKKPASDLRWYVLLNRPDEVEPEQIQTRIVQPIK